MPDPEDGLSCPKCGARMASSGMCKFCGVSAAVDGEVGTVVPSDLKCPKCSAKPGMHGVRLGGIRVDACFACHGIWFEIGVLEHAIQAEVHRPPRAGGGMAVGRDSPGSAACAAPEVVKYCACPRCAGWMSRMPLARKPLVIVDRCPAHGTWLDGGEFAQLLTVARLRGPEAALGEEGPKPRALNSTQYEEMKKILDKARRPGEGFFTAEVLALTAEMKGGRWSTRRRGTSLFALLEGIADLLSS